MIQPYKKGKDVSVMVWAAFWGNSRSNLVKLSCDSTAQRGNSANSYLQILDENLRGIWESGLTFMQDNSSIVNHNLGTVHPSYNDLSYNVNLVIAI